MPNIPDQYRIIAAGAGWRRRLDRGWLRFDGDDRLSFLQALVTNDVATLRPGQGAYAAYLTPQGRMITDLQVLVLVDRVLVGVPAELVAALAERFDKLIFADDVRVVDVSEEFVAIEIAGGRAAAVLASVAAEEPGAPAALTPWSSLNTSHGLLVRTDDYQLDSFIVLASAGLGRELVTALGEAGVVEIPPELGESMRIAAGRPRFGVDMDEHTIPLEAGLLERAISQTKGCYVGQEVVIRVLHRGGGRVAKRLVRIELGDAATGDINAGETLEADGREAGRITSVGPSTAGPGCVALGYVQRELADEARDLVVTGRPDVRGRIVGLAG